MDENTGIHLNGFYYEDTEAGEMAKREEKAAEYLREQCLNASDKQLFELYNKLISSGLFKTENGLFFLYDLRNLLLSRESIDPDQVLDVPVPRVVSDAEKERKLKAKEWEKRNHETSVKRRDALIKQYKSRFHISVVFSIICAVAIIAMFVILQTSHLPTIINYEEKVIDKYSSWEEDLKEREAAVRKLEEKFNINSNND